MTGSSRLLDSKAICRDGHLGDEGVTQPRLATGLLACTLKGIEKRNATREAARLKIISTNRDA